MTEPRYRLPSEVANQLDVSPSTVRRWSNEFSEFLSDAAGRPQTEGRTSHRRYSDQDLEILMTVKGLLAEGLTYIQVGKRLEALRLRQAPPPEGEPSESQETAVGPLMLDAAPVAPAVTVLADTLHTVADGQQLLLGSQQANREMLTVVLQDNFTLKEENAKLRDRMLELERDIAEMRRLDEARRESLEARLQRVEELSSRPIAIPPQQPSSGERPGCLGQIFGPLS
ncbi:MAG: MerR family transcriptional regulator [Anaerolineae bacterium]|jgi:DNA-binding transcriptional MerR regulator